MRIWLILITMALAGSALASDLTTPWEDDPTSTPRYAETISWCEDLAAARSQVTYTTFGQSGRGRELPLLIWDSQGLHDPVACREAGRAILLVQACIHAGESCGKDAGMGWIRDLGERDLDGVTVLFIPIFNVDGHERFGPHGRINQNGPREMGWRVNAGNLNLNRDFYKADTPEMQAWLRLWNQWQPHFMVDIHSTDGADYQYPLTYGLELRGNLDPGLTGWLNSYLAVMEESMIADGFPMAPYVSFRDWHDPRSGLNSWVAGPRYSQGYAAIRNRPGLLIETHMLKPYPVRVRSTRALLDHTVVYIADQGADLRRLAQEADARSTTPEFRATPYPLHWEASEESEEFTFLGVEYEARTSELSGGEYFVYDSSRPTSFTVPFYSRPAVDVAADLPEAYLIPPEWTTVIQRLALHGVVMQRLDEAAEIPVRSWRFRDIEWQQRPYEGHHPLEYELEPRNEVRRYPAGTMVIDLAQPAAGAAAHGLDPLGPDAFVRWGFFDAVMTRVEYVESYVIEAMMETMVAEDPGLLDELEEAKAADPELAANPWAIRYWFYERTPFYDQQAFVYPVGCLDDRAVLESLPLGD